MLFLIQQKKRKEVNKNEKKNKQNLENEQKTNFLDIAYNGLDDIKGWLLSDEANVIDNIKKIEQEEAERLLTQRRFI